MNDKKINYITFVNAANMLNISESTFRRKLKNLPTMDLKKLVKHDKGKVFIDSNIVNIFDKIIYSEKIEKQYLEPIKVSEDSKNEIEYLRKQNDNFLNSINQKDTEIRNLSSMVMKLQNDINGYIKQIGEGKKEGEPITDTILKISLVIVLVALLVYIFLQ